MQQQSSDPYIHILQKLRFSLLPVDTVTGTLVGLTPDAAARALCHCILVEQEERRARRVRTELGTAIAFGVLILLFSLGGCLSNPGGWFFLIGPATLFLAIWLSVRRYGPLRHNSLAGLASVITKVRETTLLVPLIEVARTFDGKARHYEDSIEIATKDTIARLLPRLTGAEVNALPLDALAYLRDQVGPGQRHTLNVAVLLAFGSARNPSLLTVATELAQSHPDERIREAAVEYLKELSPTN